MSQLNAWNKLPGTDTGGWHFTVGSFSSGKQLGEDEAHLLWRLLAPWGPHFPKGLQFSFPQPSFPPLYYPFSSQQSFPSHLTTTAMTTPHPEIPQTVIKQDVKPELLYCPLPLPVPRSFFSSLPSSVFVYLLHFKSVLCGAGTTSYMHLQRRLWELGFSAEIIAEIAFFSRIKVNTSPTDGFPSAKKCLYTCC